MNATASPFRVQNREYYFGGGKFTVLAPRLNYYASVPVTGSIGQSLVYEHTNAERFVPREVRTEPLDGDRILIVSGIEPGKRIVTQGAELLNQIR